MDSMQLLAKRYAQAFLNVTVLQQKDIDTIAQAITFLEQHMQIFSLLKVPLLDDSVKLRALEEYVIDRFALPAACKILIALLIAHKRSYMLIDVLEHIILEYQEMHNLEPFVLKSSTPLDAKDQQTIQDFLASNTKHHAFIDQIKHDPYLIAGLRVQSNQHLWEYSIRKQLSVLERQLAE